MSLTEFAIELDTQEIPAWAIVTFEVTNNGETPHDLGIDGGDKTPMLDSGASSAPRTSACSAERWTASTPR